MTDNDSSNGCVSISVSTSDFEQSQMDQASGRELAAHAEKLQRKLAEGRCPNCNWTIKIDVQPYAPKSLIVKCHGRCGWQALYPIARVGNSDSLRHLASVLVTNAELMPDPRMGRTTDCYLVPLDDVEALRTALEAK